MCETFRESKEYVQNIDVEGTVLFQRKGLWETLCKYIRMGQWLACEEVVDNEGSMSQYGQLSGKISASMTNTKSGQQHFLPSGWSVCGASRRRRSLIMGSLGFSDDSAIAG